VGGLIGAPTWAKSSPRTPPTPPAPSPSAPPPTHPPTHPPPPLSPEIKTQVGARELDIEQLAADDLEYNYDVQGLAALRRRLAAAIHNYKGAHAQYEEAVTSALALQEVVKSRERGDYEPPPGAPGAGGGGGVGVGCGGTGAFALAGCMLCKARAWSMLTVFPASTHPPSPPAGKAWGRAFWYYRCVLHPLVRKVRASVWGRAGRGAF
jgi:hypothetical protein